MEKILMVVAQEGFQDYEYKIPRQEFEKVGYAIDVASAKSGKAKGKFDLEIIVDKTFQEVDSAEYCAIVLVGGPGAVNYQKNKKLQVLLKQFWEKEKVIGAICIAPTILAFAGLLKGKMATVWNGDGLQSRILENGGAEYKTENVVVDGKIITANAPESAEKFAKTVLESLKS